MSDNYVAVASSYYEAVNSKNLEAIAKFLHPDFRFLGPLAQIEGKSAYLESLPRFINSFNTLTVRSKFGSASQAVVVFDLDCPDPVGVVRIAVLITFKGDLITQIEAFFDPRPMMVR